MRARLCTCACALAALGCDGTLAGFLGAIPGVEVDHGGAPVHVIVGIDGVAWSAFSEARAHGAFPGWAVAENITVFPGSSDYSWTRMLRAAPLPGFEVEYYDPDERRLYKSGLRGVLEHPLRQGLVDVIPCYQKFDYLGDGEAWMLRTYLDPEGTLPETLDALFDTVRQRARAQSTILVYLIEIDVIDHMYPRAHAVAALEYLDRRIRAFQERSPGRFQFTIVSDHGNTHRVATLVDLRAALRELGIAPVEALGTAPALEAVPLINTRTNYVGLHAHAELRGEIAERLSRHPWVEVTAAQLAPESEGGAEGTSEARSYALWAGGERYDFRVLPSGDVYVAGASRWCALGFAFACGYSDIQLSDREAFERTLGAPWPDVFHRLDTAWRSPAARIRPDIVVSLKDEYASYGFTLLGEDEGFVYGFHGSLGGAATRSVVATQRRSLPPAVREDDLADLFPDLLR